MSKLPFDTSVQYCFQFHKREVFILSKKMFYFIVNSLRVSFVEGKCALGKSSIVVFAHGHHSTVVFADGNYSFVNFHHWNNFNFLLERRDKYMKRPICPRFKQGSYVSAPAAHAGASMRIYPSSVANLWRRTQMEGKTDMQTVLYKGKLTFHAFSLSHHMLNMNILFPFVSTNKYLVKNSVHQQTNIE